MIEFEHAQRPFTIPVDWDLDLVPNGDDEYIVFYEEKPNCVISDRIYEQ